MSKLNRDQLGNFFESPLFITILLLVVIFAIGFWLRAMRPDFYPLGFDQIQIVQNAAQIQQHHFVLIGPRTGPAPMFTGPLIYYVAAALMKFSPAPQVLVSTALALYSVTFLVLAGLVWHYLDDKWFAWLLMAIFAFSPFQIQLDRIPWNPNLTVLAAALVFFPLLGKLGKKLLPVDLLLIMSGCFLGYEAHFSGLLLSVFVGVAWLIFYRRQWWLPLLAGLATVISLIPTALFDYRHQFMNWHGLLQFFQQSSLSQGSSQSLLHILLSNILISLENLGKMVAVSAPYYVVLPIGLVLFIFFILNQKQPAKLTPKFWLSTIWIFLLAVIYIFYKGSKPEYYFLLQFPALYYLLVSVLRPFCKKNWQVLLMVLVIAGCGIFSTTSQLQHNQPPLAIGNQVAAAQLARQYQAQTHSIIMYDMKGLDGQAMQYLLADLPSGSATTSTQTTHLIYPFHNDSPSSESFGQLAVWQDPRTNSQKNYLVRKQIIFVTPLNMTLLENHYVQNFLQAADTRFEVIQNSVKVAELYALDDKANDPIYNDFMSGFMKNFDRGKLHWQSVKLNGQSAFVFPAKDVTLILFLSNQQLGPVDQNNFTHQLEIL